MTCLRNEPRSFCHFWGCTQVLHFGLLLIMRATLFILWDSCPVVNIMVIWIKFAHSHPVLVHWFLGCQCLFLPISCLTTSSLPWFMDLTFHVPMQYCPLQHWILLSSPHHSWASFPLWPRRFILSGAVSSSPLLLPRSILNTFQAGGLVFWCPILLSFYTVHEVLLAGIMEWFCHSPLLHSILLLRLIWETCVRVKKQWLEPCMEQLIGSRLRIVYYRAVSCYPVCLTYMLSTSWEMLGWMSYKLESR